MLELDQTDRPIDIQRVVLTTNEVTQVSGVARYKLHRFINYGVLGPKYRVGIGDHKPARFSIVQATALRFANYLIDNGCSLSWAAEAAHFVAGMSPQELEDATKDGTTLVYPKNPYFGRTKAIPVPDGKQSEMTRQQTVILAMYDLSGTYRSVKNRVLQLADSPGLKLKQQPVESEEAEEDDVMDRND